MAPLRPRSSASACSIQSRTLLLLALIHLLPLFIIDVNAVAILPAHLMLRADDDETDNNAARSAAIVDDDEDPFYAQQSDPGHYSLQTRPSPSDALPVQPPAFAFDAAFLPTEGDLDAHQLRRALGAAYDPAFMSSVRPLESIHRPNGTLVYDLKRARKLNVLPPELRDFSVDVGGHRKRLKMRNRKSRRRVLRFLSLYSSCPVHYQWKDLGPLFWPRWIREGRCYNGRSCSIPAGMSCQPKQSDQKTILWWHCPKRKHKSCRWIPIRYPIITRCTCSC